MRQIEFFYFIGSTYSYLSVTRAADLAAREGVVLDWRPFSVRTLMREQDNVPFATKPVKMRYMWRDLERRASRFGVPFDGIPPYPVDPAELANHVATLATGEGWCREFTQAAYRCWFLDRRDPGEPEALRGILAALGRDADDCIARASAQPTKQAYLTATDRARTLGIFGSPTFVVGQEIFWGDDRLEDALAWCRASAV
ncbi:MAG: 2-hydroxychromene-2-carboxylate isomerase [Betaproteobacteria bacterium]|jgi:2-hydroxychromene-2-carboxylate isomerase|nr:2-hydroxychromene-2-carboxylate isomerase [Betaproteobacteria bacterium]MBP6316526.1 2-hydroxychromene-2-carboxylate isomerase [Rubrivivax sp.]MBK7517305.1 2-hydroxychromene-2-carboxylate isomerase [Betaproteobacteria bacterium]MBK8863934.1 2-hydroxychromene-2-carboxylate isomerase [Betaproteobacteria bacterium]MBK9683026.1 2-hydroxychromene-2-carboxylate isomerase [Betaproteobacteria bacterium]